jgi:hypothetical protein
MMGSGVPRMGFWSMKMNELVILRLPESFSEREGYLRYGYHYRTERGVRFHNKVATYTLKKPGATWYTLGPV